MILIPVMASRLMLSLKKTAAEPGETWSLSTMTRGFSSEDEVRFASHVSGRLYGISLTPAALNKDIELDVVPPLPRNRQSCQVC